VLLNSIGDASDRVAYRAILTDYLEQWRGELSDDAVRRLDDNPLRVLDSKADAAIVAGAPIPIDHLGEETAAAFAGVTRGLERRGIEYEIAPRLVRGLDYYNRTVFEYVSRSYTVAQDSLGGGGRYDPLSAMLGGPDTPAIGLAMGVDRIVLAMSGDDPAPEIGVFVVVADPDRRTEAIDLTAAIRRAGAPADLDLGGRSVKAQFKAASRRGAKIAAVVGDEWDEGFVTMRDLHSGDQQQVPIEEVPGWVISR